MQHLKQVIAQETPIINTALFALADELPFCSKPIARHVLDAGGKRMRPLLAVLFYRLCRQIEGNQAHDAQPHKGLSTNSQPSYNQSQNSQRGTAHMDISIYRVASAVELLHAATLLHDDILDNADMRRSQVAAHRVFSANDVILAGDAMLAKALTTVTETNNLPMVQVISQAVLETAEGQIAESAYLHDITLTTEQYLQIILGKTAWLLRASCELGALYASVSPVLREAAITFGQEVGIAFQLVDDALDFSPAEEIGKPSGGDLAEGKCTPPIQEYFTRLDPAQKDIFQRDFSAGTFSPEDIEHHITAIRQSDGILVTRKRAAKHIATAKKALSCFPDTQEKTLLTTIADYIVARSH